MKCMSLLCKSRNKIQQPHGNDCFPENLADIIILKMAMMKIPKSNMGHKNSKTSVLEIVVENIALRARVNLTHTT